MDGNDRDIPKSLAVLDLLCEQFVGSFMEPLYFQAKTGKGKRFLKIIKRTYEQVTQKICRCFRKPKIYMTQLYKNLLPFTNTLNADENYTQQHKLRDLFLWSVFMGNVELAKVLLMYLKSRICASLIASKIFTEYSKNTNIYQLKRKMKNIADEFELYAVQCIDTCYEYNETKACDLMLRQIPMFGNITCAQVYFMKLTRYYIIILF